MCNTASLYETEPVGVERQPWFINTAVAVATKLDPGALHVRCQEIERDMGRVVRERWGPREIDLDLLLFGDRVIETAELTIPHPELAGRRFVLVPLVELDGTLIDPRSGRTVKSLLEALLSDEKRVTKLRTKVRTKVRPINRASRS